MRRAPACDAAVVADLRAPLQAVRLLSEYKRKHVHSNESLGDLLYVLEALLPDEHHMPPTLYHFRKHIRKPLHSQLDANYLTTAHMCSDPACDHIYTTYPGTAQDACPRPHCGRARFK